MTGTKFDTLIRNGLIVDGTGASSFYADIGIKDGRIAEIGDLSARTAGREIDADGRIVAPGHVTQHSHYDAALFWDPYCQGSALNGVTTVVNSNCGFGFAPVRPADIERTMLMMSTTEQIPVEHQRDGMPWDWESFPDWLGHMRNLPKGVNVATYLPLNPLLVYVMGVDAAKTRVPTDDEMATLHRLVNEAMDAGAIGISMSAMGSTGNSHVDFDGTSMPTDSMEHDALVDICRAVVERGAGVIQVLSRIAIFGDRTITERIGELAKGSGVRVIHNVFLTSDLMPHMPAEDLAWLDEQRSLGRDITAGALVNRGWVEMRVNELDTVAGQLAGVRRIVAAAGGDALRTLLADPTFLADFDTEYSSVPQFGPGDFAGQTIIGVGDHAELEHLVGKTLGEVVAGTGQTLVEALAQLALDTDLELELKSPAVSATGPEQAMLLLAHNGVIGGGSDGGAHTKTFGMGHYATDLLIWLVRENKLLTLEEAHFQLALKSARSVDLTDRGALLPGYWADVLVYDLDELHFDTGSYEKVADMPNGDWRRAGKAGGYRHVLVNGEVTFERDACSKATPGRLVVGAGARRAPAGSVA